MQNLQLNKNILGVVAAFLPPEDLAAFRSLNKRTQIALNESVFSCAKKMLNERVEKMVSIHDNVTLHHIEADSECDKNLRKVIDSASKLLNQYDFLGEYKKCSDSNLKENIENYENLTKKNAKIFRQIQTAKKKINPMTYVKRAIILLRTPEFATNLLNAHSDDITIASYVFFQYPGKLKNAPENLKNNKIIVKAALKKSKAAIYNASHALQQDKDFIIDCIRGDYLCPMYIPQCFQRDEEVVFECAKRKLTRHDQKTFNRIVETVNINDVSPEFSRQKRSRHSSEINEEELWSNVIKEHVVKKQKLVNELE